MLLTADLSHDNQITTSQKCPNLHDNVLNLTNKSDILKNANNVNGPLKSNQKEECQLAKMYFQIIIGTKLIKLRKPDI